MSRLPRTAEHLKTGFTAEATAAAQYRANAARAEREEMPHLAEVWLELATAHDELAIRQLEAAGKVRDVYTAVVDAMSEEEYDTEVLYPKMIQDVDEEAAELFREVIQEKQGHLKRLEELEDQVQAATEDIPA